jgi:hypothetical protein
MRNEIPLTSAISGEQPEFKKWHKNEGQTILAKEVCDTFWFQAFDGEWTANEAISQETG